MADRKRRKRMVTQADSARKYAIVDLMIVLKEWSNSAPFVGFVRRTRSTLLGSPFRRSTATCDLDYATARVVWQIRMMVERERSIYNTK
jgi:hypothetical protein